MNYPVQGGAADVMHRAMRLLFERYRDWRGVTPALTVHDEILLEADAACADQVGSPLDRRDGRGFPRCSSEWADAVSWSPLVWVGPGPRRRPTAMRGGRRSAAGSGGLAVRRGRGGVFILIKRPWYVAFLAETPAEAGEGSDAALEDALFRRRREGAPRPTACAAPTDVWLFARLRRQCNRWAPRWFESLAFRRYVSGECGENTEPFDAKASLRRKLAGRVRSRRHLHDLVPTCKAQKPIIRPPLAEQPENRDLIIFCWRSTSTVKKAIVREFRAQSQSTLIAFRGKTETGRSVGDTDPNSIAALVKSTLAK